MRKNSTALEPETDEIATGAAGSVIVIKSGSPGIRAVIAEAWRFRELLLFLIWRDISVRYKQTILGILWVVFQPLVAMVIFTLVFNRGLGLKSGGIPYPLFVLTGWVPWGIFSQSLNRSGESLVQNSNLITKIYFPRIIIPAAAALAFSVDFMISLLILAPVMIYYRVVPGLPLLALPGLMLLLMVLAAGVGTFFSALNVRFRDVKYILGFLTQMWFFATPVVYQAGAIPERFRAVAMLNPMMGITEGFRWCLLGAPLPGQSLLLSVLLTLAAFVASHLYFTRVERTFADVV